MVQIYMIVSHSGLGRAENFPVFSVILNRKWYLSSMLLVNLLLDWKSDLFLLCPVIYNRIDFSCFWVQAYGIGENKKDSKEMLNPCYI